MVEVKSKWQDRSISNTSIVFIYASVLVIFLLPLVPVIFNKIRNIFLYFLEVYPAIIAAEIIISLYSYYEKKKMLYTCNEGIVIRWALETGEDAVLIRWENIRRITVINSWSPKSYFRWKRIRSDLPLGFIIKSFIGSRMMIIETLRDKIYFVDLTDEKGYMDSLKGIINVNNYVAEIPILKFD
jgi:hypothetical protein